LEVATISKVHPVSNIGNLLIWGGLPAELNAQQNTADLSFFWKLQKTKKPREAEEFFVYPSLAWFSCLVWFFQE
jgi:hypothetical protein